MRQYTVGPQPTPKIQTYVWRQRISNTKLNRVATCLSWNQGVPVSNPGRHTGYAENFLSFTQS